MELAPLVTFVLKHPVNPWLTTEVRIRAANLDEIEAILLALRQRIEIHELN